MSDDLLYWKNALMGNLGPIHENDPQCGWYRTKPKKGFRPHPVRIWRDPDSGQIRAQKGQKPIDPCEIWTWCCLNPVSALTYEAALRGEPWPDEIGLPLHPPLPQLWVDQALPRRLSPGQGRTAPNDPGQGETVRRAQLDRGCASRPSLPRGPVRAPSMPKGQVRPGSLPKGRVDRGSLPKGRVPTAMASHEPRQSPGRGHNSGRIPSNGRLEPPLTGMDAPASAQPPLRIDRAAHKDESGVVSSLVAEMLDPFDDAREMADHIALLWDDVASWLESHGPITDQVKADRCANYASALSNLETTCEDMRVREKKPFLEACRSVDAKWKPVLKAAQDSKSACKKAVETFLMTEWLRREETAKQNGSTFTPPRAGSFGRPLSLRTIEKLVITDVSLLAQHYAQDERLLRDEGFRKILSHLAEGDIKCGRAIAGAKIVEQRSVA